MQQLETLIQNLGKQSIQSVFKTIADIKVQLQAREDAIKEYELDLQKLVTDFRTEEGKIIAEIDEVTGDKSRMISAEEKIRLQLLKQRKRNLSMDMNIIHQQSSKRIQDQKRELAQKRIDLANAIDLLKNDYLQFTHIRDELTKQKDMLELEMQGLEKRQQTLSQMLNAAHSTRETANRKMAHADAVAKRNKDNAVKIESAAQKLVERHRLNSEEGRRIQEQRNELKYKKTALLELSDRLEAKRVQIDAEYEALQEQIRNFKVRAEKKLSHAITATRKEHEDRFQYEIETLERTREELYRRIEMSENEIARVNKLESQLNKKRIQVQDVEEEILLRQAQLEKDYRDLEIESQDIRRRHQELVQAEKSAQTRTEAIIQAEQKLHHFERELKKKEQNLINKEQFLHQFETQKMIQWEQREKQLRNWDSKNSKQQKDITARENFVTGAEKRLNQVEKEIQAKQLALNTEIQDFESKYAEYLQNKSIVENEARNLEVFAQEIQSEKSKMSAWENELIKREKNLNFAQQEVDSLTIELEKEKKQVQQMKAQLSRQLQSLNSAFADYNDSDLTELGATGAFQERQTSRPRMDV